MNRGNRATREDRELLVEALSDYEHVHWERATREAAQQAEDRSNEMKRYLWSKW